jgi:hypothetical protein
LNDIFTLTGGELFLLFFDLDDEALLLPPPPPTLLAFLPLLLLLLVAPLDLTSGDMLSLSDETSLVGEESATGLPSAPTTWSRFY